MTGNSIFYDQLKLFFANNVKSHEIRKKIFIDSHFQASSLEKCDQAFISHRCSQWLADLKSKKRRQSLLIEDLELACEILNEPASVVLRDKRYWNDSIHYFTEDFLTLIQKTQDEPRSDNTLEGVYFPICVDPPTGTVFYAIIVENKKQLNNQITNEGKPLKQFCILYIVHSLQKMVENFAKKFPLNGQCDTHYEFYNYQSALGQFKRVCRFQKSAISGLGYQLEKLLKKMTYYFSSDEKSAENVLKLLSKQKMFYGFQSDLYVKYCGGKTGYTNILDTEISVSDTRFQMRKE